MGEENPQRRRISTLDDAKDWLRQKQKTTQSAKPETTHAQEPSEKDDSEQELSEDDLIEDGDDLTDIDEVEIPIR